MQDVKAFSLGEYEFTPIAVSWGEDGWRAGVLLNAGGPRGNRPTKSFYTEIFASEAKALRFASDECARLAT